MKSYILVACFVWSFTMHCTKSKNAKLRDFWFLTIVFIDCDYDTFLDIISGLMGIKNLFLLYFTFFNENNENSNDK